MNEICKWLYIGRANFDVLVEKVQRCEKDHHPDFNDEQVWTFLLAASYAITGSQGVTQLSSLLIEDPHCDTVKKLWFECLPISPRHQEGNTNLDFPLLGFKPPSSDGDWLEP